MRIAITNRSMREAGGVEVYLSRLIRALAAGEHSISVLCEQKGDVERPPIFPLSELTCWCVEEMGKEGAMEGLRSWKPDIVFGNGLQDPDLEQRTLEIAPGIFFAHDYSRTCISGNKLHRFPRSKVCAKKFGWKCLLHYYPRRCGGWNPLTMKQLFVNHTRQLGVLRKYKVIVTHTNHMRQELLRHDLDPDRVQTIPFPVSFDHPTANSRPDFDRTAFQSQIQILFLGRMSLLKGGDLLIDALPLLQRKVSRFIRAIFAGDGPEWKKWEEKARKTVSSASNIEILFPGWLSGKELDRTFASTDLLAVPSRWPEPLGSVGLEAGQCGIPAAAFAVGGIPEWLVDGFNGHLAAELSPSGLAAAIFQCVENPEHYLELSKHAREVAGKYDMKLHLRELLQIFHKVIA